MLESKGRKVNRRGVLYNMRCFGEKTVLSFGTLLELDSVDERHEVGSVNLTSGSIHYKRSREIGGCCTALALCTNLPVNMLAVNLGHWRVLSCRCLCAT